MLIMAILKYLLTVNLFVMKKVLKSIYTGIMVHSHHKHVILLGFMCSGKTTYGKLLAQRLQMPFVDVDEYISEKYTKTIAEIFAVHGEMHFRQLEKDSLEELLQMPPSVIASGGGTPCYNNNIELINRFGVSVYLQADAKTLFGWIKDSNNRPLLQGKTDDELLIYIENLLEQRKPFYEQAQIIIPAENFDVDKLKALLAL